MPAPEILAFGDGDHQNGSTGLSIDGGGFGAFPGSAWIYENADRSGAADQLTIGAWNDIELTGIEIPASPNNGTGTRYLFVQREDLAWSQAFAFTLSIVIAADFSAGVSLGDAYSRTKHVFASFVAGLEAGDTDGALSQAQALLQAQLEAADQVAAITQAARAIEAGLEAGETWAALAAAAADFQAAASFGAQMVGETAGEVEGFIEDEIAAAANFQAAAQALASLSSGAELGAGFTSAHVTGALLEADTEASAQFAAAVSAFAGFTSTAQLAMAVDITLSVLATLSAGVSLGATFSASVPSALSILGAEASVRRINHLVATITRQT